MKTPRPTHEAARFAESPAAVEPGHAPPDLHCARLAFEGEELHVFSYPLPGTREEPELEGPFAALTPAQREVARLVLAGLDNAGIARERGTSPRTVTKQLEGIFRRLGVGSRRELFARYVSL